MIENIKLLYDELVACGLAVVGIDGQDNVHFAQESESEISPLIIAAHDKSLDSVECLALKQAISLDLWDAYVAARNAYIEEQRIQRYRNETDPLFMKVMEEATVIPDGDYCQIKLPLTTFQEWKANKEAIRAELPYLV